MRGNARKEALAAALMAVMMDAAIVAADPLECREMAHAYAAAKPGLPERQVNTYLAQAARKGCAELVSQLLKDGASVHARRREGDTALHHAVKVTTPDVARLLLDAGADIEQRDLSGATPLYLAADANRLATVRLLLDRGANVDAPGRSAATPLIAAAYNGNERLVALLIERKAGVHFADNTGKAAVVYAAARGFGAIVEKAPGPWHRRQPPLWQRADAADVGGGARQRCSRKRTASGPSSCSSPGARGSTTPTTADARR